MAMVTIPAKPLFRLPWAGCPFSLGDTVQPKFSERVCTAFPRGFVRSMLEDFEMQMRDDAHGPRCCFCRQLSTLRHELHG